MYIQKVVQDRKDIRIPFGRLLGFFLNGPASGYLGTKGIEKLIEKYNNRDENSRRELEDIARCFFGFIGRGDEFGEVNSLPLYFGIYDRTKERWKRFFGDESKIFNPLTELFFSAVKNYFNNTSIPDRNLERFFEAYEALERKLNSDGFK